MRSHQRPAQPRTIGDRGVRVGDRDDAFDDEMDCLAPQCHLQPVGDVAAHFLFDMDRVLADLAIESHRLSHRVRRRLRAADHLHQRNEMRRVERMADHAALGMLALGRHAADEQARRARGDHRVRRRGSVDRGEQLDLDVLALGPALLHEGRAFGGRRRILEERKALAVGAGLHRVELLQCRPGIVDEAAREILAVRCRIIGGNLEPACQKIGCPACADGAGADDADTFCHDELVA